MNEENSIRTNRRKQYNAELDEKHISKDEYPLLMNTHKHDETLSDYGGEKFEEQENRDTAEKFSKAMDRTKPKHKELDIKKKL